MVGCSSSPIISAIDLEKLDSLKFGVEGRDSFLKVFSLSDDVGLKDKSICDLQKIN